MSEIVKYDEIEEKIIVLRDIPVILDSEVAYLYGVETREVNQAVKNNPNKFPNRGYVFELDNEEWANLKSKILTSSWGGKNKLPKAFTEKGLYMLATTLNLAAIKIKHTVKRSKKSDKVCKWKRI